MNNKQALVDDVYDFDAWLKERIVEQIAKLDAIQAEADKYLRQNSANQVARDEVEDEQQ